MNTVSLAMLVMVMDSMKFTLTAVNLHPPAAVGVAKQLTAQWFENVELSSWRTHLNLHLAQMYSDSAKPLINTFLRKS